MGCYPLRVIVSKALGKCNGRERWMEDQRMDYAMAYPPGPHPETLYVRPVARTVTFSGTNSVHMIPPNPPPPQQQQQQHPEPQPQQQAPPPQPQAPPPQPEPQPQPEQSAPAPEQGAPPAEQQPRQPKRGKKKPPRRVRFGPEPPPPQQQQQQEHQEQQQQPEHAPNGNPGSGAPGHHGPPGYLRYTPSPLPRWEATPRRHEYFSGEYRYSYPTPVREGIYRMATDANRLTTIFSEENPNACAIV